MCFNHRGGRHHGPEPKELSFLPYLSEQNGRRTSDLFIMTSASDAGLESLANRGELLKAILVPFRSIPKTSDQVVATLESKLLRKLPVIAPY